MPSSLIENYNSEYVRQSSRLTGKQHIVEVWVEDEYDVPFWNDLLNDYKDITFRITPYRHKNLNKGKGNILKFTHLLGTNLIACVDSDYDYLLPEASEAGRQLNNNPYILQTFTYSVENYNCHPSTLNKICINATLETTGFDFVGFFKEYSKAIYPLLLWSLMMRKEKLNGEFTFNDFKDVISFDRNITEDNMHDVIETVSKRVKASCAVMTEEHPELYMQMNKFEKTISAKGVRPDNCFLFINGHILQDSITQRLLVPLCKDIINRHIQGIFRSKGTMNEKERKKAHYDNITRRSLTVLLASNFEYKEFSGLYANKLRPRIDSMVKLLQNEMGYTPKGNKEETLYA